MKFVALSLTLIQQNGRHLESQGRERTFSVVLVLAIFFYFDSTNWSVWNLMSKSWPGIILCTYELVLLFNTVLWQNVCQFEIHFDTWENILTLKCRRPVIRADERGRGPRRGWRPVSTSYITCVWQISTWLWFDVPWKCIRKTRCIVDVRCLCVLGGQRRLRQTQISTGTHGFATQSNAGYATAAVAAAWVADLVRGRSSHPIYSTKQIPADDSVFVLIKTVESYSRTNV